MRVVYNGVDLGVLKTEVFDWESIYDDSGVDYLYSRVTLVVRCVVNGFVNVSNGPFISYRYTGNAPQRINLGVTQPSGAFPNNPGRVVPNDPVKGDGIGPPPKSGLAGQGITLTSSLRAVTVDSNPPSLTHQTIRFRLQTPRGKLYVFRAAGPYAVTVVGQSTPVPADFMILESPVPFADGSGSLPCDAKNGPFPKVLGVYEALGDANTLLVDFAIETFVNESQLNVFNPTGILLSNRFSQTHLVSDDYHTVVRTEGVAVFRPDLIFTIPQNPDYSRRVLFMPVPLGFVRGNIVVRGRPDATGVEYSYDDKQQKVNFPAGPFVRAATIHAVHRQMIVSDKSVLEGALGTYERILNIGAFRNWAKADLPHSATTTGPQSGGGSGGAGSGLANAMRKAAGRRGPPNFKRGGKSGG